MVVVRNVLIALIAVLGLAFAWLAFEWSKSGSATAEKPYGVAFNLVDQSGAQITEAAFQEKPTAVFFGFTHCPDVCPTTLFELDGWLRQVDPNGELVNAYFVTVDPERDDHEILGQYISNVTDRIVGITGDPKDIRQMAKGYNIYFKKVPTDTSDPDGDYVMDHTASVFLLNNGGRFKGTIAYGENPDTAVKKLQNLIKG
ncbi:SCO family protein [Hoeflea prorocentri]|uniref:SCO family protein n=1 Tax=Hoeflea prorocentri TaxID=1922333 RepID=A0A9X3ZFP9_9HYPH|nr:SCO family protein [Hoeflea prorocentri]MCY6379932.1 SCO family protein [Hoeflea prorocentri]MDA5397732.1 SCO family protein [Hoeflea prorocentri]